MSAATASKAASSGDSRCPARTTRAQGGVRVLTGRVWSWRGRRRGEVVASAAILVVLALVTSQFVGAGVAAGASAAERSSNALAGTIAFSRWDGTSSQLYALSLADGNVEQLTRGRDSAWSPTWSADGSRLAFARRGDDTDEVFPSWIVVSDLSAGRKVVPVRDPRSGFGDIGHLLHSPAISPDGRQVSFTDQGWNIAVAPADRRSASWRGLAQGADSTWSPDGAWITFTRVRLGPTDVEGEYLSSLGIWMLRPDGTGNRRITSAADWSPRWSPDGRKLAVIRRVRTEGAPRWDLLIVSPRGKVVKRLVQDASSPTWSPDGSRVAFVREDGIYVIRARGGIATRVLRATGIGSIDWAGRA